MHRRRAFIERRGRDYLLLNQLDPEQRRGITVRLPRNRRAGDDINWTLIAAVAVVLAMWVIVIMAFVGAI